MRAANVPATDRATFIPFVSQHVESGVRVFSTDEAQAYVGIALEHETVHHKAGEYVCGDITTNGIKRLWALLKRAHKGIFHKLSPKHVRRYVRELTDRQNHRGLPVLKRMAELAAAMDGKRLTYRALTADNGLPSGARS
ncbi:MAG: transposase [Chloroflexi bacterium]|nr:transposase [Chloroflexota bacterium]